MPIHCYCKKCRESKTLSLKCCKCCDCSQVKDTRKKVDNKKVRTCDICCCVISKCICKGIKPKLGKFRPRTLTVDLPLYDEHGHLLGYIKKGATIDEPACLKSADYLLEKRSEFCTNLHTDNSLLYSYRTPCCLSSCMYAQEVISKCGNTASPRWTTKTAFDHAICGSSQYDCMTDSDTIINRKASCTKLKASNTRKCPCP